MKENEQNVGATAFDYPNDVAPNPYNNIYYGNQYVPHPTNSKAKIVDPNEIMRNVLEGK